MKSFVLVSIFTSFLSISSFAKTPQDAVCKFSMGLRRSLEVAGLNIANHKTTRTTEGGSYIPKEVKCNNGDCKTINTNSLPIMVYEPNHPDANANGYVSYPNIDLQIERTKFQVIAERIFALAKKKECGMSVGLSTDSMITVNYKKDASLTHVFIKNPQGEIIIWESLSNKDPGSMLNLLYGKSSPIPSSK